MLVGTTAEQVIQVATGVANARSAPVLAGFITRTMFGLVGFTVVFAAVAQSIAKSAWCEIAVCANDTRCVSLGKTSSL